MYEADDRLDGDLVWEIFAAPAPATAQTSHPGSRIGRWAVVLAMIAVGGLFFPPMAVLIVCLVVAWPDIRKGRQIARTLPDRAAARACARFNEAWGAWKFGLAAFGLMWLSAFGSAAIAKEGEPPSAFVAGASLWIAGLTASASLAASGVWASYRSEMRVWIGEGINRARTLLLSMLLVGFVYGYILPLCFCLVSTAPRGQGDPNMAALLFILCVGSTLIGPIVILVILDAIARRVIADAPSKLGKAVPAVGKWAAKPIESIALHGERPAG